MKDQMTTSSRRFTRLAEDFTCDKCGQEIHGTGYTNHCPRCLWSKHVDVNPGDRAESCHGMMEPVGVRVVRDSYDIQYHCAKCGAMGWNKADKDDNYEKILALSVNKKILGLEDGRGLLSS